MGDEEDRKLFSGVKFTILHSDQLPKVKADEVKQALEQHGAIWLDLLPNDEIDDLEAHTHIVSAHVDFPQYDEALDAGCHVVKPSWIEQSIIKGRQAQARQHSPDPALIFQDVVVSFGDLPQGDRDAIMAGVMAMGGMYSPSMTKLVTHIVSLTEESDKIRVVKTMELKTKVVLPHWFDDCLRLGRKISETPYLLPDPPVLAAGSFSNRELDHEPDIGDAKSAVAGLPPSLTPPPSSPVEPATPRKKLAVFKEKRMFFCDDLKIHSKLAETLSELAEHGGGSVTKDSEKCDVFVGHYRDGAEYIAASQAGKTVGNLVWFYSVIMRNRWSNPLNKLLHYPVPRNGVPGFQGLKISLSNYTGDARVYLENIIREAGAEFTKTMKVDNTHLITAHKRSEKCDAAQEWNIDVVNHLWLEDSYAKCKIQSLTNPRYTHFPPHTNLSEIVGQTKIDLGKVEELFFPGGAEARPRAGEQKLAPRPSPRKTVRAADAQTKVNGAHSSGRAQDSTPIRRRSSEKENEAPSSRASKLRANANLEQAALDIAEFEKERKRKGGVTHGRKRGSNSPLVEANGQQYSSDEPDEHAIKPAKRQKIEEAVQTEQVPVQYKMLVTGDDRWLKRPGKESNDKKAFRNLGIAMITDPEQATLLCAPKILRTRKFLVAIASAPSVVNTSYLDAALRTSTLPPLPSHALKDPATENKYCFKLSEALARAALNNKRLLRGWTVYVTEHINGGFETFADIVHANGGTAVLYKGRTGVQVPRRRLRADEDEGAGEESQHQGGVGEEEVVYLVSGTAEEERRVWGTFGKRVAKQGLRARVVKSDWLLQLALTQSVEWRGEWELDGGEET